MFDWGLETLFGPSCLIIEWSHRRGDKDKKRSIGRINGDQVESVLMRNEKMCGFFLNEKYA